MLKADYKTDFGYDGSCGLFAGVKHNGMLVVGRSHFYDDDTILYEGFFKGNATPHLADVKKEKPELYNRIITYFDNEAKSKHRKYYFEIKKGSSGLLKDGRQFNVISVPTIMMCSDGTMRWGDVELIINGEHYVVRVSELIENIWTIGDLTIN